MKKKLSKKINEHFDRFAAKATFLMGSSASFTIAFSIIIIWLISGPLFGFSDTWQLIINTGTTIITFLMVFLIQRSQNKESMAVQLKLNELVATSKDCSNRLIDVEDLTQDELEVLHKYYIKLARRAKQDQSLKETHSIDEEDIDRAQKRKATRK